jgi:sulfite oxidase
VGVSDEDSGETWMQAELTAGAEQTPGRAWAWVLWEATIQPEQMKELARSSRLIHPEMQLVCRATDESFNTQPESARAIWNLRGIMNNSWHRVAVELPRPQNMRYR